MSEREKLIAAAKVGVEIMTDANKITFNSELEPDYEVVTAYVDEKDGLPVSVVKVVTNHLTRDFRGEMHPGAFCTVIDCVTTSANYLDMTLYEFPDNRADRIRFVEGLSPANIMMRTGISRCLKTKRLRPIPAGSTIYMVNKLMVNTPISAYILCKVYDDEGHLVATGSHDKTKLTKPVNAKL